ncbi:alpha/beta fold hydrolase BchO [Sulfitobacter sp. S190]|uniref:alpha/beta fold hydrolase BchO n=1 Tax=Sulfitobacter sp. S190 TaxID=2867022 RepID=UPI0021A75CB1|nr:alpha/beta fold hydrolase BchO [Sulfitobacter sp. S190]UWR24373.1 alpha/beta fold hydrolase [Sulfitobacter sp. S190]
MKWETEKYDWPMSACSRFVRSGPHHWHVQVSGTGETLLLLHGAGGATQSWRHLFPMLAKDYKVVAIDLPGQGFTRLGARHRCGLEEMAEDIAGLCRDENIQPRAIVGHSAGAAIGFDLAPRLPKTPHVIGINAALAHFKGVAGLLFPLMAKTLAMMPGVAGLFTAQNGNAKSVRRLIEGTGSTLPLDDLGYYRRLVGDRDHVNATLQMMAQWDLGPLLSRLPRLDVQGLLIAGSRDKAVPSQTSAQISSQMKHVGFKLVDGLGHLAHEEDPASMRKMIAAYISDY